MTKYIQDLPSELLGIIKLIKEVSSSLNYRSYLVGGFVRDLILKRRNLDLDICVEGNGITLAEKVASFISAKIVKHVRFGTANLTSPQGFKIDIATCRREIYLQPAMLPKVEAGTIEDDLKRRDFTINALAIRIYPEGKDDIIDFFGGYQDILNRKIRVLHEKSFIDDPTRILRAIRFEQRFNFHIEPYTLKLIKEAVSLRMFDRLSAHRLRDELILMLKEENVVESICRIEELFGWKAIFPGLKIGKKKIRFLHTIKKTIDWYNREFSYKRKLDGWLMYLIGLLDGLDKEDVDIFLKRFSLRRGERKRILSYINEEKRIKEELKKRLKPSRIYTCLEPLSYEAILLLKAKHHHKILNKNIGNFFKIYNNIRLSIDGSDLKALGIKEGPYYQKIFKRLIQAKLDGKINSKEEEIKFVKRIVKI